MSLAEVDKIYVEVILDDKESHEAVNAVGQSNHESYAEPENSDSNTCYVNASSGSDDTGDGSSSNPVATLSKANQLCGTNSLSKICIADNSVYSENIALDAGISDVFAKEDALPILEFTGLAGDALFSDLSSINRRIFTGYNGILYAACEDSGAVDLVYASTDGDTWAAVLDNADVDILCAFSTDTTAITGAYFGDNAGKIIKAASPTSTSTVLDIGTGAIVSICQFNGYLFALWQDGTDNKLYRSSDGESFSEIATDIEDLGLTGLFRFCTEYTDTDGNHYLVIALDADIITSSGGISFTARKTFAYQGFEIKKLIEYDNYLYVACGANGIYRTCDFEKWVKVLDDTSADVVTSTHLYSITSGGDLYTSRNGTDFSLIKSLSSAEAYLGEKDGYLYLGDKRYNSYLFKTSSDVTFTGIYFNTDYLSYAVDAIWHDASFKHCTFNGFCTTAIKDASGLIIENSKITSCYSGAYCTGELVAKESEFSSLDAFALYSKGSQIDIDHITIFDAGIGIYLSQSVTGDIKNSIISGCHEYGIYSSYTVGLEASVYSSAKMYNVSAISCKEANPLFCSTKEGALDLKIKTAAAGYVFPLSIAKGFASDNKDAGCYDYTYTKTPREAIGFTFASNPSEFSSSIDKSNYSSQVSLSGAPLISFDDVRLSFSLGFGSSQYITKEFSSHIAYLVSSASKFWFMPQRLSGYSDNSGTATVTEVAINDLDKAIPILGRRDLSSKVTVITDTSKSWDLNKWRGWHVGINGEYYRVLFNDQTSLIIDASLDITSAGYEINRIKVALDVSSLQRTQLFYDGFLDKYPKNGFTLTFTEAD